MDGLVMGSRRKAIFKDAGIYALSSYSAQALDMVNAVLVRLFLGPAQMGVWAFLQVILNYAKHASLGVTAATSRDVPYYLGKGQADKANEIQNLVFSFSLATSLLTALAIAGLAWFQRRNYPPIFIQGMLIACAILVLQRLYNLFVVLLRAHQEFSFAAFLNFLLSATGLLFTILLTWKFKLHGFLASTVLSLLLGVVFILWKTHYRFELVFSPHKIWPIIQFGSTMLVFDVVRSTLVSIDRVLIAKFLGLQALGLYSVALMASNYVSSFPVMLSVIFFPRLQETFAKKDDVRDLEVFLVEPIFTMSYLLPVVIGALWIFSEVLVRLVLPQYVAGVPALKCLLLGAYFYAPTHTLEGFLITIKKHRRLIPLALLSLGSGAGMMMLAIRNGWGISGVAAAAIFLWALNFVCLSLVCFRKIFGWRKVLKLEARFFGVFFYLAAVLTGIDFFSNGLGMGWKLAGGSLVFALAAVPLVYRAERHYKVISTILSMLKSGARKSGPAASTEFGPADENTF
ncbi:MAG: oligosaccharide flippase family protein [Candidatus Omnitrophica bacterium]|nr:oligosaccharide flippase family protein [Candidatus Omnitrophota bacterium]